MSKYILSIDQGTTSCRAILVDKKGEIVGIAQEEFEQIFPQSGWVEHDAMVIWDTQKSMIDKVLAECDSTPDDIIAIGITNQRETVVVWDKNTGKPIYNAIVWQDKRTSAYADTLKEGSLNDYIVEHTGLIPDSYFSGTKLKWILDQKSAYREQAAGGDLLWGTIDTWLIWNLTDGRSHVTDYTNASRTMLFNIKTLEWDRKLLDEMDIPHNMVPDVQPSISDFGYWGTDDLQVPIYGVGGDQQSALFGQACFEAGMAKNTYGTGCFMLMNIGGESIKSENGLLTTLCCTDSDKPQYALEGSVFVAGAAIQWLRDGLQIIDDSSETEDIAKSVDADDVVVVPAFAGLGAPYWDGNARGAIFGLSRSADKNQIIKATLDSLAYQTSDVLTAMEKDSGIQLEALQVDGGACENDYLMQLQSDILNVPVDRPKEIETTALGAAYMAGIKANIWTFDDISQTRSTERRFDPKMDDEVRKVKLERWKDAIDRTRNWIK